MKSGVGWGLGRRSQRLWPYRPSQLLIALGSAANEAPWWPETPAR